ncbi:MAG: single-stranded-DNA-specific exonuclease RecJ, partial [Rhizobiales bacterium]|nr:single-stranded-DNA-specific exonuclease RecJ [Hyphomicrobiales bacterium]
VAPDDLPQFLTPTLKDLMPDPSALCDMDRAASRIADAITGGEKIAVLADYDVDGAASAALMARYLRGLGRDLSVHVPDRITEGYGPNAEALGRLIDDGASLIVTVDCGIAAASAFAAIQGRADVIVLDHHQAGEVLPDVAGVVNPNRLDDLAGLEYLAAAGVVFMTLVAVNRELRARGAFAGATEPDLVGLLPLVGLATVCDVVPLTGLNRAFVTQGLRLIQRRDFAGLAALADRARLNGPASVYHLGFMLGPRINAGGRIGRSELGYRLLASDETSEVEAIAGELERLNAERQAIEAAALDEACEMVEASVGDSAAEGAITVASANWHPGVVGLVAARLVERYRTPAIAIALDENGLGRGSGRSIAGVDLGSAIRGAVDAGHLKKGGGHAMAAGLTIAGGEIKAFSAYMNGELAAAVSAGRGQNHLSIDAPLTAGGATQELMALIDRAGPFGNAHPEPRFAFASHRVSYAKTVGNGHVRVSLKAEDGRRLEAIAFRAAGTPLGDALSAGGCETLHVAGKLKRNHWQGRETIQLMIDDAARPR